MRKKKMLGIVLVIIMIVTSLSEINMVNVKAATTTEKLQSLMTQYVGTRWKGYYYGTQCKGFANLMFKELFGVTYIGPYDSQMYYIPSPSGAKEVGRLDASQMTLENAKALLKKGVAGDFIQVRRRGKTWGHSMIFVSQDSAGITVFDCNSDGNCGVKSYHITWDSFYAKNSAMSLYHANANTNAGEIGNETSGETANVVMPSINNVKIDSIDFNHITLNFSAYNSGLVRVVAVSKTTGQEVKQDFTSGLDNVTYTFQISTMTNPGKDFYIRIYAYSTSSGGNETLHAVTYGPNIGSVRFPDKELRYNMETIPTGTISTTTSLRGWVIGENITKVTAVINTQEYECTRCERVDVGNAFPGYDFSKAGFQFDFNTSYLDNGSNTLSVRAYTSDMDYVELYNGNIDAVKLSPYYVDWSWYYFKYHNEPEIAAIGLNPVKLIEYYYAKGIEKGHSPCVGFDPVWYLDKNEDIKSAEGAKNYVAAYVHFVKYCIPNNEKRNLSPFLNLQYYQESNADLANMKADELFYHYYVYGSRLENRSNGNCTNQAKAFSKMFVTKEYAAANQDVKNVLGDGKSTESAEAIWSQFFAYTLPDNSKRITSNEFDMAFYMNKYGIATTEEAFWRYINSGYANGEVTKQVATKAPTNTPSVQPKMMLPESTEEVQTVTPESTEEVQTVTPESTEEPQTVTPENTKELQAVTSQSTEKPQTVTPESTEEPQTVTPESTEEPQTVIPENTKEPQTVVPENTKEPQMLLPETTTTQQPTSELIETEELMVTKEPQNTNTPIETEDPTETKELEITVVPTVTPVIDDDFSEDLISEISLYSDLDEDEELRVGDQFTLYADIYPENFEDAELVWSSDNEKIVTVNEKGIVQCVGAGTVTVTATAMDGSGKSAFMTFKVKKALGSDNYLSDIKFSQGKLTPKFKKTRKSYSLVLKKGMSKVVIKVKTSDSAAKVKINGKVTEKVTVKLKRGQTKKVTIRVIAENGKGKTYLIKVNRKK